MRVSIYTLGCKLNQVESEALLEAFTRLGHQYVPVSDEADLYIFNTCTVTSKAEQKARRMIRRAAKRKNKPLVIITGCYAQVEPDMLEKLGENLFIVPLERKSEILQLPDFLENRTDEGMHPADSIQLFFSGGVSRSSLFDYNPHEFIKHSRAFLKIEDGCDNICAYCRVRIARGKAVSLDPETAVSRALRLEELGYREIVLTGVNITAYSFPEKDIPNLAALIRQLDGRLKKTRIRVSSLEPDQVDDDLLDALSCSSILPHFHLPVQSGSDAVLQSIQRNNRAYDTVRAVSEFRKIKHDPFIAADIMTGLPGETEANFLETIELLERCDISQIHVFPYSPRPGTPLYDTKTGRVPESIRDERAARIRTISREHHARYIERQLGRTVTGVLESPLEHADGHADHDSSGSSTGEAVMFRALTENYLHATVTGIPAGDAPEVERGSLCRMRIDSFDQNTRKIECSFLERL